jgi:yecA family protein
MSPFAVQQERALLPPELSTLGELPFTREDRETLRTWLAEEGWPRERIDITMLEGYLVALLVWPVRMAAGAWLPPIWGQRGWKVPAKIGSPDAYSKFIKLVIGYMQALDRGLSASPARFTPTLPGESRERSSSAWARGFLKALEQNSQGLQGRSDDARSAVSCIAHCASSTLAPTGGRLDVESELIKAVLTLTAERPSRGPLGAIEPVQVGNFVPPEQLVSEWG